MANNLKKFQTEADYSAATLNYPAVSWITSGDILHYDISGDTPTPPTPTYEWVYADGDFNLSTPVYSIKCVNYDPTVGNICDAYLSDGNGNGYEFYSQVTYDEEQEEDVYYSILRDSTGGTIAESSNDQIDIYAALGYPLYLNGCPAYTECYSSECVSWWSEEEQNCVDWDTGEGCCEEQCIDEITIYQCQVKIESQN